MKRSLGPIASLLRVRTRDIENDAVTLAKIAAGAAGDVLLWDASGNPLALAEPDDDGRVLTSKTAGDKLSWEWPSLLGPLGDFDEDYTADAVTATRHSFTKDFSGRAGVSTVLLLFGFGGPETGVTGACNMEIWYGAVGGGTELVNIPATSWLSNEVAAGDKASGAAVLATRKTDVPASAAQTFNFHFDRVAVVTIDWSWALMLDLGET